MSSTIQPAKECCQRAASIIYYFGEFREGAHTIHTKKYNWSTCPFVFLDMLNTGGEGVTLKERTALLNIKLIGDKDLGKF